MYTYCHIVVTVVFHFPYNCEEMWRKMRWKVLYLSHSYEQKNRLEKLSVFRMGVQDPPYHDNANNM
jgi:hypothetical protein